MSDNRADIGGTDNRVDQSNNSGVRISGKGHKVNISTRKTNITQYRTELKNHVANSNSSVSSDGLEVLAGAFIVTVVVAWLYLKHFEAIVDHLHNAILLSMAPMVGALGVLFKRFGDERARLGELLPHFFGLLAALLLVLISTLTIEQLPPRLIEVAAAHGVKNFWFALRPIERQVLIENIVSIACIGLGTTANALMNVHTFADELLDVTDSPIVARLYAVTFNFRTTRSVIVQLLLATVAGLAISGEGVKLFAQLQFYLQGFFS